MLEVVRDTVWFRTGNKDRDEVYTVWLFTAVGLAISRVGYAFIEARARARAARIARRPLEIRWTAVTGFLLLAATSVVIVNVLRYDYQKMTARLWREVEYTEYAMSEYLHRRQPRNTIKDINKALFESAREVITPWIFRRGPWFNMDWVEEVSVWERLHMLLVEPRRAWWVHQWFRGYSSWAIFVTIECTNRGLDRTTALSFILLAYCVSLSAMQALFFGLLLTMPSTMREVGRWTPKPVVLKIVATLETCLLVSFLYSSAFMHLAPQDVKHRIEWSQTGEQWIMILAPMVMATLFDPGRRWRFASRRAKPLTKAWSFVSISSMLTHLTTWYFAWRRTAAPTRMVGTALSWLQPWRVSHEYEGEGIAKSAYSILTALGHHHWISAIGWDVLLSLAGLCAWSVISSADARDMLRCSIAPWLGDGAEDDARPTATGQNKEKHQGAPKPPPRSPIRTRSASRESTSRAAEEGNARKASSTTGKTLKSAQFASSRGRRAAAEEDDGGRATSRASLPGDRTASAPHDEEVSDGGLESIDDVAADAEGAGLTYALWVVGGLGMASAAVFGADGEW